MKLHRDALNLMDEAGKLGIRVDTVGLQEWRLKAEKELTELRVAIQDATGIEKPGSPKEVAGWLDSLLIDGKGSDYFRMLRLEGSQHEENGHRIQRWRTLRREASAAINLLDAVKIGRFHYEWKLSEKTNRLYSGVQNLGWEIRNFLLPDEDQILVLMDYEQQELRIQMHEAGETELLKALNEGQDFHKMCASWLSNKSLSFVTDEMRDKAKAMTYAIPYGQDAREMAWNWNKPEKQCQILIDRYMGHRPKLQVWIDALKLDWEQHQGEVTTKMGHIRKDCPADSVVNTKVQGSAADVLCMALLKMAALLRSFQGRILVSVHDSVVLSVPQRSGAKRQLVAAMEDTVYGRMPVKVKAGLTWGACRKGEVNGIKDKG